MYTSKYWIYKTNTDVECIDISKIAHFLYTDGEKFVKENPKDDHLNYYKMYGNRLQLTLDNDKLIIVNGKKAEELYNYIINYLQLNKQLLEG